MLADEMGMYSGGYSLGAKMLFPQVGSSVVRSGVGPAPEHSPTTMLEKAMSHMHLGFFMYPIEPSATTIVLVDDLSEWKQTETGFDSEYQRVIDELRNGGREITADEVVAILRNSQEDPEEPEIKLFSLQSMAHFLVTNEEFDDPIIGPDPSGLMQIEWHIHGNGLLVMAFIEGNEIHFIAQADETSDLPALDESVQLPTNQIVEGVRLSCTLPLGSMSETHYLTAIP